MHVLGDVLCERLRVETAIAESSYERMVKDRGDCGLDFLPQPGGPGFWLYGVDPRARTAHGSCLIRLNFMAASLQPRPDAEVSGHLPLHLPIVGNLVGFAPWIVYWVLVGNVPFIVAAAVSLGIAVGALVIGRAKGAPGRTIEIGAVGTFLAIAVLTLLAGQSFLERWMQPLSNAAIFLVALTTVLIGKPFVRDFAQAGRPAAVIQSEVFRRITTRLTWLWVATFAGVTVSSSIPAIMQGDATILDTKTPLLFACYWVIPFSLLGLAALASRILSDQMTARVEDVVRKTTFVAYGEATIDELYYLAQQHADREVGAGQEAYDVKVGGMGTPLVGDDSRKSWPSTYKVRESRR